jgi:L-lactate dehydrogenase complex protein LldE
VACALFITCLTDTLAPQVGSATVEVLERQGLRVDSPREQTCCGQMHFNSGYVTEARVLARRFVEVFAGYESLERRLPTSLRNVAQTRRADLG